MVSPNRSHDIISRLDSSPVMEEKSLTVCLPILSALCCGNIIYNTITPRPLSHPTIWLTDFSRPGWRLL